MGTCSRLATMIDADMLVTHLAALVPPRTQTTIAPAGTPDGSLDKPTGNEVACDLGDRYLLRYLVDSDAALFVPSRKNEALEFAERKTHWVTPTPYSPEEAGAWLAVPSPHLPRRYVLLLDPQEITGTNTYNNKPYEIRGPRWVRMGGGIEYILPNGFPWDAIVAIGVAAGDKWPLLVT